MLCTARAHLEHSSDGRRVVCRRRPRVQVGLRLLLLLPWAATAQSFNNSSNGSEPNCTDNETLVNQSNYTGLPLCPKAPKGPCIINSCHNEMRREARSACMEFQEWGANEARCAIWQGWAQKSCEDSCSDCEEIGKVMFEQCVFTLQLEMSFENAILYCKTMSKSFEELRCPSARVDKVNMCFTPEFEACNLECGNYHKCDCWIERGKEGLPTFCEGETELPGFDGLPEDCSKFPQQCMNHIPQTACGMYKHCPPNMCIIKGVTCPILDSCQSVGVCAPGDGNCYYSTLPDNSPCDDELFYTHTDRCKNAACIGIEDKCARYAVQCETANPCLVPTPLVKDSCDPPTGSCVFNARPDGLACSGQPGGSIDGTCVAGLCRRNVLDLCANKVCPIKGFCYGESVCDPWTGDCIATPKPEGEECDDGDDKTRGDRCIEGQCVGDPVSAPKFAFEGQNPCEGKGGVTVTTPRYFGSVPAEENCKEQCIADPWCHAYSYGYYVCYIYGGGRTVDPDEKYWGQKWMLLHPEAQPQIVHGSICYVKQDTSNPFLTSDETAAWFSITVTILVVIPGCWGFFMIWKPVSRSFRSLTGCCGGVPEEEIDDPDAGISSIRKTMRILKDRKKTGDLDMNVVKDTVRANYFPESKDVVEPPSPDGKAGVISAHPNSNPGVDDIEQVKLNQAAHEEEPPLPSDPRGQVQAAQGEAGAPEEQAGAGS